MSISLSGKTPGFGVSFSATHDPDGSVTIYPITTGVLLSPEDAVKFANYILDSQPAPEPADDISTETPDSDVPAVTDTQPETAEEVPAESPTPVQDLSVPTSQVQDLTAPEDSSAVPDSAPVEVADQPAIADVATQVPEPVEDQTPVAPAPAGWPSAPTA
jgi:hypothetical protein